MKPKHWGALALACTACGGRTEDGRGATGIDRCGAAAACGGDLTGSWAMESYCAELEDVSGLFGGGDAPACESAFREAVSGSTVTPIDARVTFDATTYRFSGTARMAFRFTYTDACFRELAGVPLDALRCGDISASYRSDPDYDGTCAYLTGACQCDIQAVVEMDNTGPYETIGSEILVDGDPTGGPYCVEGSRAMVDLASVEARARLRLRR
jgi:hypothetical protein